jgi:Acetyltransferase (GNAT) domain
VAELLTLKGPLDGEQLEWLTRIYGPVDAKYRSPEYVRHQFVDNPFGWSAHVFAVDAGEPVGHCGVVPLAARLGEESVTVGKLEALAVAPSHRGRRADGGSLATDILTTLYPFAVETGLPLLFGLAPPAVARIHVRAGCRQLPLVAPAYVHVTSRRTFAGPGSSRKRRVAAVALSQAQLLVLEAAYALARLRASAQTEPRLERPGEQDAELVAARSEPGSWTVSGADAWDWLAGSGTLRALELDGRFGSRALLRIDESDATTVQIVAWRPARGGLLPAILLLGAAARIARARSAPTLRFQPWHGDGGDGSLARACRLLGFVERAEADLLVYTNDESLLAASPALTPFFYVTF